MHACCLIKKAITQLDVTCTCPFLSRCGLWRERHGIALQISALIIVAQRESATHIGDPLSASGETPQADALSPSSERPCFEPALHQSEIVGKLAKLVLDCAAILLQDPVWAVRQAVVLELMLLVHNGC